MRLLAKFSADFTLVFGLGPLIIGYLSYNLLQTGARQEVLNQARLMMQAMLSARDYTTIDLKPLLEPMETRDRSFLPQSVPAFAAAENFKFLRSKFPDYAYKEAALNPTNPRNRALDWEADVINAFRNQNQLQQLTGERISATGPSLYLAQPIRAGHACMECHSLPSAAPAAMVDVYGRDNGFGWKEGDVIAAQIISVPESVPLQMANNEFRTMLIYLLLIFLASLVVLNLVLYYTIAKPAERLSALANRISLGELDVPELPVKGKDEIADLAESFNRMRRSLTTAMKMLGDQDT
jgi:HAMP domain-containing protein